MGRPRAGGRDTGTGIVVVALAERSGRLLTDNIDLFRSAVSGVKREHPFTLIAMVVLVEPLHCVWILPMGDADYPTRWKKINAVFLHS